MERLTNANQRPVIRLFIIIYACLNLFWFVYQPCLDYPEKTGTVDNNEYCCPDRYIRTCYEYTWMICIATWIQPILVMTWMMLAAFCITIAAFMFLLICVT